MRRPSPWFAAALLLVCAVLAALGLGERGEEPAPEPAAPERPATGPAEEWTPPVPPGETLKIRGRIRLVGNEPFTELVLSDAEGNDWFIEGPSRDALIYRQQEILTLRGEAAYRDLLLADGRRMGVRKILRNAAVEGEQP